MFAHAWLQQVLDYDPADGCFRWKVSRKNQYARAGSVAGYIDSGGYRIIEIKGKAYKAHRLVWFYMTGQWPKYNIDHINGEKHDNRFCNLRDATHSINMQNRRKPLPFNSTGFLGVRKNCRGFLASITVYGKRRNLGTYKTPEEAHAVYLKAKRKLHPGNTL